MHRFEHLMWLEARDMYKSKVVVSCIVAAIVLAPSHESRQFARAAFVACIYSRVRNLRLDVGESGVHQSWLCRI